MCKHDLFFKIPLVSICQFEYKLWISCTTKTEETPVLPLKGFEFHKIEVEMTGNIYIYIYQKKICPHFQRSFPQPKKSPRQEESEICLQDEIVLCLVFIFFPTWQNFRKFPPNHELKRSPELQHGPKHKNRTDPDNMMECCGCSLSWIIDD